MKYPISVQPRLWQLILPLLCLANVAHHFDNLISWAITLSFFLFVPGTLALLLLKPGSISQGTRYCLSLGLSLSILIIGGLALNSLRFMGLERPLTTPAIFGFFDLVTLLLLLPQLKDRVSIRLPRPHFSVEKTIVCIICTLLPFIVIGGANRLNNGASNTLIMVAMAIIGLLLIVLVARPGLQPLYPYAIFTIGLSILFCNSLRGWDITGHDIHHEFSVFYRVLNQGYWRQVAGHGDPYNACLSITILPTIFAKLASVPIVYIYKGVFQIIVAAALPTLYFLFRRFASHRKSLIGVFAFMSFPTFTNDLPFLNRQEIAFIFVAMLLFVNFLKINSNTKLILTLIFITSVIFSHYSSSYITLSLLLLAPMFYKLISLTVRPKDKKGVETSVNEKLPMMNPRVIIIAILLTFTWNAQITASTGGLVHTIESTVDSVIGKSSKEGAYNYSANGPPTSTASQKGFFAFAASEQPHAKLLPTPVIPTSKLGSAIAHILDIHDLKKINVVFHALLAKTLQVLAIGGTIYLLVIRRRSATASERYLMGLCCACLLLLTLFTTIPKLAVDYDVTRLFQQSLMVLWLPSVLLAERLFRFLRKWRMVGAASLYSLLYLNLVGFIPQTTGGFPPQLPLNNSGIYHDFFYVHGSDVRGFAWLQANHRPSYAVFSDTNSTLPYQRLVNSNGYLRHRQRGYIYLDHTNTQRNLFKSIVEGSFIEYNNPHALADKNLIYSNGGSTIYFNPYYEWQLEQMKASASP